jgi:hypothetical protein
MDELEVVVEKLKELVRLNSIFKCTEFYNYNKCCFMYFSEQAITDRKSEASGREHSITVGTGSKI